MGPRDRRLGHGPAHLLLLWSMLPAGHLRRDLVQTRHAAAGQARFCFRSTRGADDIEVVESVGLGEVVDVLLRHRR